ncbi:unnamed protein product [Alopecurus aequalis]
MALRSLSRAFPAGLLRQAWGPRMAPLRELSPASGGRLMGTRCQEKVAYDDHRLLRQEFTDLQQKTRSELDKLLNTAIILNKAANVTLGVAIIGAPCLLIMGSKDQA